MKILFKNLFIILFLGLMPCGCDNDPASPAEGHTEADGFKLEDENSNEIYREFKGQITGSIALSVGQTLELSVHFLDHNGNEIEHADDEEHGEEEDGLKIEQDENGMSIAIVEVEEHCAEITEQVACESSEHCEWHADEGACEGKDHDHNTENAVEEEHGFGIHITGVSAGSTTFQLKLMHGTHADYTSTNNVPITVSASN